METLNNDAVTDNNTKQKPHIDEIVKLIRQSTVGTQTTEHKLCYFCGTRYEISMNGQTNFGK